MNPTRCHQRGFSLLEVLVALAILAISLGVLFQIFSRAAISTATAADYSRALVLAESCLARVGQEIALEETRLDGEVDEVFVWELSMMPLESETPETARWRLWQVRVTVLWREGVHARRLALATLRLGPLDG